MLDVRRAPYAFLAPFLIVFAVFWCWPLVQSVLLSFQNTRVYPSVFDLTVNWRRLLIDRAFQNALWNTLLVLAVQVPFMLALATALAIALNARFLRCRAFLRFAFFAPVVVSEVAYSVVFRLLFNTDFGAVNGALASIGVSGPNWLHQDGPAKAVIVLALTWRWTGYNAIILLAGLQSIPKDLYEAARMDGAGVWSRFIHVTLPQLAPVLTFCFILSVIGTMQLFAEPWLITDRGGPGNATETLGTYLYKQGFVNLNFGYASAIAYSIAALAALISALNLILTRKKGVA
ncbi:MAG: sugar ABC transporter permease [Fulvimarina manganoxydans]|uniref:carbohydrate ABC transporter permease n=1 Tax=Fulvimarina manganoxydans TaxID=937218 RepID=UPI0023579CFB|nr:sugar ABC transporter permease [Fulvimarina manganoxydans]MCK5933825.1 sugar ABC transporter permease [Fulvimarina manganoxydans]